MNTAATASNHRTSSMRRSGPCRGLLGIPTGAVLPFAAGARRCHSREKSAPPPPLEKLVCRLIEAMRAELLHAGEMLALANEWKAGAEAAAEASLEQIETALEEQFQALQAAQAWRTTWQRRVRQELQASATIPFSQIVARLPAKYQPLVASLEHENERLVGAYSGGALRLPFTFEPAL